MYKTHKLFFLEICCVSIPLNVPYKNEIIIYLINFKYINLVIIFKLQTCKFKYLI